MVKLAVVRPHPLSVSQHLVHISSQRPGSIACPREAQPGSPLCSHPLIHQILHYLCDPTLEIHNKMTYSCLQLLYVISHPLEMSLLRRHCSAHCH